MSPTKTWTPEDAEKGHKLLAEAFRTSPASQTTETQMDLGSLFNEDNAEVNQGDTSDVAEEKTTPETVVNEDDMDLQSVTETQDAMEEPSEIQMGEVEVVATEDVPMSVEAAPEDDVQSECSTDSEVEYEISDEARERAARAAEAQARVQQFLAQKAQRRLNAQSAQTKAPVAKRESQPLKKTSEEIQLEQALFAQAEWKMKFAQGKIRNESNPTTKPKAKKEPSQEVKKQPKRRATVPSNFEVLNRKSMTRKLESADERELREIAEGKERLAKQLARNRKFRESGVKATELQCRAVHSTRPLTVPVTPKMMSGKTYGPKPVNESTHVSIADVDNYYKNMRKSRLRI